MHTELVLDKKYAPVRMIYAANRTHNCKIESKSVAKEKKQ